jgi:ribonuclease inhibitor
MTEADLHEKLAEALDFGPYYGRNLAALWDRLTVDVPRPVTLVWEEASESRKNLGAELFDKIVKLFDDVRRLDADAGLVDSFNYKIVQ